MKRVLYTALVSHLVLSLELSGAYAFDQYDGEWIGSATSTDRRCEPARVTLTVRGKIVVGQARFEPETQNINGTVFEDGTFAATIGFRPLAGKFTQNECEGTFRRSDCVWKILLKHTK